MKAGKEKWKFTLYVAGETSKSKAAMSNLKSYCEKCLAGHYDLVVVDLLKEPHLAEADQILAIPTLIRKSPLPTRKIIGDLSNTDKVLQHLEMKVIKE
jgi:circadian clock protein KaiB